MSVSVKAVGKVRIIVADGALTVGGRDSLARPLDLEGKKVADLGATLEELLAAGHTSVVLDLARVNFMDSAGIGELVSWRNETAEHGGDLKLLKPTRRIRELLDLTRLTPYFEIFDDEQAATASFA